MSSILLRCIVTPMLKFSHCAQYLAMGPTSRPRQHRLLVASVCCATVGLATFGFLRVHAQSVAAQSAVAPATPTPVKAAPSQAATPVPQTPTVANPQDAARLQQIADLLKLAQDLKAEVDKSTKDELSIPVIRKAAEIEVLAHKVRTASPGN
jgi:hypothetical protein